MRYFRVALYIFTFGAVLGTAGPAVTLLHSQAAPQGLPQTPTSPLASKTSPRSPTVPNDDYVIGAEDVIEISVWHEPELTMKAVVRPDGKIGIRLLNDVQASGLTTKQLQDHLEEEFARYVTEPVVSVIVTEVRSQIVHIIGSVGRPGAYPLGGPLTIMEILARAGGLSDIARKEEIAVVRTEGGKTRRLMFNYKTFVEGKNLQQNILLRNGDVIVVP